MLGVSTAKRKEWIEPNNELLSIEKQCDLLGLSRSSYYYVPCGESSKSLALMKAIDILYTKCPFYGARRLSINLPIEFQQVNISVPSEPPFLTDSDALLYAFVEIISFLPSFSLRFANVFALRD